MATQEYQERFEPSLKNENPPRKEYGFEIATIANVNKSTGVITLKRPLQFEHDSSDTIISRTLDNAPDNVVREIHVQTCLHVGLLSRPKITSLLNNGGSGYNRLKEDVPTNVTGSWSGPRDYVVCNSANVDRSGVEVYGQCYENRESVNETYCGNRNPDPIRWHFDTEGLSGPNSLFGGHTMMRYGSSSWIDGVEASKMGTPGGYGTLARYTYHFHMVGFPTRFNGL